MTWLRRGFFVFLKNQEEKGARFTLARLIIVTTAGFWSRFSETNGTDTHDEKGGSGKVLAEIFP